MVTQQFLKVIVLHNNGTKLILQLHQGTRIIVALMQDWHSQTFCLSAMFGMDAAIV